MPKDTIKPLGHDSTPAHALDSQLGFCMLLPVYRPHKEELMKIGTTHEHQTVTARELSARKQMAQTASSPSGEWVRAAPPADGALGHASNPREDDAGHG